MTDPGDIDGLFRMLADPTRRRILDVLASRGELTVGELSDQFPHLVTSGISKHLMGLRAAGVVCATRRGRLQIYRLETGAVADVLTPWLEKYERYWERALGRLKELAEEQPLPRTASHSRRTAARRRR